VGQRRRLFEASGFNSASLELFNRILPDGGAGGENVLRRGLGQLALHEQGLQLCDELLVLWRGLILALRTWS
jgi:hypothetical protein